MFDDKVCIITGAANGIGRNIAKSFHKEGAVIAFIDTDLDNGQKLLSDINGEETKHFFFHGNVGKEEELKSFINEVIKRYGKVDYLVNNACYSNKGLLTCCSYEEFNDVLRVGVTAPYYLTMLLKDHFNEGASIVNISSTRAKMSQRDTESYSAAKGGISALTHAMAMSLAGSARVNSISPGWIDTTNAENFSESDKLQHPSQRVGNPEDIARVVLFLCDPKSDFINGENITVDGGMSKKMIYHDDEGWRCTSR
ncbi:SDR family oxidoreductase [Proteiniclasticum sp. C24MP]|uniref:SDR family oxidoreductase n=1 Tax=Proteiniclasticum sp. C24MP TaxID=3374101 RepID=UPI0037543C22